MRIVFRLPAAPRVDDSAIRGLVDLAPSMRVLGRPTGERWVSLVVPNERPALNRALEVGTRINESLMRDWSSAGYHVPSVYELAAVAGLRYKPEPPGQEWWQTFLDNLERDDGDCEDLAMHQAAWYRHTGEDPQAKATSKRTGRRMYHAIVKRGDGTIEDPSMPLGLAELRRKRAILRALRRGAHGQG